MHRYLDIGILRVTLLSIESICLEWNGLGMLDNCFAAFCDGLAANSCLRALDLRNNQIRHDSAEELTAALKRNNTLQAIGNKHL